MNRLLLRTIKYALIVLFVMGCSTQNGLARKRPPKWVKQRPVSSKYYIGIAVVNKNPEVNYIQMAKKSGTTRFMFRNIGKYFSKFSASPI